MICESRLHENAYTRRREPTQELYVPPYQESFCLRHNTMFTLARKKFDTLENGHLATTEKKAQITRGAKTNSCSFELPNGHKKRALHHCACSLMAQKVFDKLPPREHIDLLQAKVLFRHVPQQRRSASIVSTRERCWVYTSEISFLNSRTDSSKSVARP